jgi:hypothetical protein
MLIALAAAAAAVCGPSSADTLAQTGQARVYVRGKSAYGCHRGRSPIRLGAPPLRVKVAGRFAAIVRATSVATYDLRARRRTFRDRGLAEVGALRLNRSGLAVFYARTAVGWELRGNGDELYECLGDDPRFLHLAGGAIACRTARYIGLHDLGDDTSATPRPGRLMTIGDVRFDADRSHVYAGLAGRRRMRLGDLSSWGWSSSAAGGIDALIVRGHFVAVREFSYYTGSPGAGEVRVYDLARRTRRTACQAEFGVGDFTLTEAGAVTCS